MINADKSADFMITPAKMQILSLTLKTIYVLDHYYIFLNTPAMH